MMTSRGRSSSSRWAVGVVGTTLALFGAACGSATNTIDGDAGPTGVDTGVILPGIDAGPAARTDSGPPVGSCGDGACVAPENAMTCATDCTTGDVCGDGRCGGTVESCGKEA